MGIMKQLHILKEDGHIKVTEAGYEAHCNHCQGWFSVTPGQIADTLTATDILCPACEVKKEYK